MPARKPVRAQDVTRYWSLTRRGDKTRLRDYRQLGQTYDRFVEYAPHGQKRTRTDRVVQMICRKEPGLSASYVRGILYKARRFARACSDQPRLLMQLEKAALSWRQVTELLSIIRPEPAGISAAATRERDAGLKQLNLLLRQTTRQRRPLLPAALISQMKAWSRTHPGYLGVHKASWRDRATTRKLMRQLGGVLSDWKQLKRSVPRRDWQKLNQRFLAGQKQAVEALRELEQGLEPLR